MLTLAEKLKTLDRGDLPFKITCTNPLIAQCADCKHCDFIVITVDKLLQKFTYRCMHCVDKSLNNVYFAATFSQTTDWTFNINNSIQSVQELNNIRLMKLQAEIEKCNCKTLLNGHHNDCLYLRKFT